MFEIFTMGAEELSFSPYPSFISHMYSLFFFLLAAISILDVIFTIITAVKVFQLSKVLGGSDHARFETEKERSGKYLLP